MIERKKKLELFSYDADWKGCYILFKMASYRDTIDMQKAISKVERDLYKIGKEIKKAEKAGDDVLELMEKQDELSTEQLNVMIEVVKGQFLSGSILDGTLRDMTADDIEAFDIQILGDCVRLITGQVEGKV